MTAIDKTWIGVSALLDRYAPTIDRRDIDECIELFSDDAVLVPIGEASKRRTALPEWMDEIARTPGGRHLTTNVLVSRAIDASVSSVVDIARLRPAETGRQLVPVGESNDTLGIEDGAWRFARQVGEVR
jgi:hypothetical protein